MFASCRAKTAARVGLPKFAAQLIAATLDEE